VYKARNKVTGEIVALKRVRMDNEKEGFPVTAIREIKILKVLNHKNVVQLKEIVTSKASEYNHGKGSIYMVMEFSDHDLTGLTDAGTRFTTPQIKCYMKQLLEGLAYCHKNRVLHRDIKGSNLLINNQGQLKLADFGLARPFDDTGRQLTNRVITLWYRPPELLLGSQNYGPAVDMWSVGCIFAELLLKRPILPGKNEFEQIDKIFKMFGTPTEQTWPGLTKLHYYQMVATQCGTQPYPNRFAEQFGMLDKKAQELLAALLAMDPSKRITAKQALDNDYFWEAPYPSKPEDLPKYAQSHEFTAKKRRQDAAKQGGGAGGATQPAAAAAAQPAHQQPAQQRPAHQQQPANNSHTNGAHPRGAPFNSSYNKRPRDGYEPHNPGGPRAPAAYMPPQAGAHQSRGGYGQGAPPPYPQKALPTSNGYGQQSLPTSNGYGQQALPTSNGYGQQALPTSNGYGHHHPQQHHGGQHGSGGSGRPRG